MQRQVYKIHSDFYYVKNSVSEFECKLKENLKKQKQEVFVGDFVELSEDNNFISKVLKRNNFIPRPKVANIDCMLIVTSFKEPELDFVQLNRYLTFLNYYKIPAILCFNKEDLEDNLTKIKNKIKKIYRDICQDLFFICAKNGYGTKELISFLEGKTVALCGMSGVGKSTLLNTINKDISLKTGLVSKKTKKGTHTTRHVEIIDCKDFKIIDTPGFSNLKFDFLLPSELIKYFPDIEKYTGNCKYSDCLHDVNQKGVCSVFDNIRKIDESRYLSYLTFLDECKSYKKEISKRSIKTEDRKKQTGSIILTKISKQKRLASRNTDKQRIKNYDTH